MNAEQIRPLDLQEKILDIIQENYNDHKGTNEAELASSEDIAHLLDQEMAGLICWISLNEHKLHAHTPLQLLTLYKAEMNTIK